MINKSTIRNYLQRFAPAFSLNPVDFKRYFHGEIQPQFVNQIHQGVNRLATTVSLHGPWGGGWNRYNIGLNNSIALIG